MGRSERLWDKLLARNRNFLGLPFFLVTFWASERELGIIAEL